MENVEEFFDDGDLFLNPYSIGLLLEGPQQAEANVPEEVTPVRNEDYVEEVVPRYSPEDFFSHFRMSREVFEELLQDISNRLYITSRVDVEKKVLYTIWMLAKQESFIACSDRFGISSGTGHLIFHSICKILCDMRETEINWPVPDEARATATYFLEKSRFPGIIGAIDGCHIPVKAPCNNPVDYYNRHSYHSMILQAVCDHRMMFIDIFVGMPGKCHDARVFRNSTLFHKISDENIIPQDFHLLGDSAYPLLPNLMVPFRDNGQLNNQQHNYNYILNSCRSKIEQAFGRLKGKWRKLKYVDINIENIPIVITAACVLHNYTLRRDDNVKEFQDVAEDDGYINNEGQLNMENAAAQKRQHIMNLL